MSLYSISLTILIVVQIYIYSNSTYLMFVSDILNAYYNYISSVRKPKSVKIYKWHLDTFEQHIVLNNKSIHNCNAEDVISYLKTRKWNTTARRHFLTILKSFLSKYYLQKIPIGVTTDELRYRLTRENEVREILNISLPKKEHKIENKALSIEQVRALLDSAKKTDIKDYCLIYLLLYFGLRKSELLSLSPLRHIDIVSNKITITADISKTSSDRELYFNDCTKQIIFATIKLLGNKSKVCDVDEFYLNRMLSKYDKVIGRHIHPHMCRHTFNNEMMKSLKNKIDFDEKIIVRILMGHINQGADSMTAVYSSVGDYPKRAMVEYHYMNLLI